MEYTILKNTDIKVSRICMGGCPMGGYGWGAVAEQDLIAAVHTALENGVNFFDTADTYGLGQSERTLAKGLGTHRKDVIIESKFGVRTGNGKTVYDNSPAYIEQALDGTLQRLNTDYIDVYTIHYRDKITPIEAVVEKLQDLRRAGKIRAFGLSNIHGEERKELLPYKGQFVNCQDEYSLACRKWEQDLRTVQTELSITPMTWGSLGQGILTGKYTKENTHFGTDDRRSREIYVNFHGEKLEKNLQVVEMMRPIAEAHDVSLAAVAIRFILDYLEDSVVLVGAKRPSQITGNLEAVGWHLTADEIRRLAEVSAE